MVVPSRTYGVENLVEAVYDFLGEDIFLDFGLDGLGVKVLGVHHWIEVTFDVLLVKVFQLHHRCP